MKFNSKQIDTFCKLPQSGIYAFVNEVDKKVYLVHSNGIQVNLVRNLMDIANGLHNCKALEYDYRNNKCNIVYLESCSSVLLKHRFNVWYNSYKNTGYSHYRSYKGTCYKVRMDVERSLHLTNNIVVKLVTSHYESIEVARFNTMAKAKEFLSRNTVEKLLLLVFKGK